jgi:hypothetical protein
MRRAASFIIVTFASFAVLASEREIRQGRGIYESILRTYPGLTLYLESGLTGENARLVADVPRPKWRRMSSGDQQALAAFVQSELSTVHADPSRYSLTPTTAPIWPTHRAAFQHICDSCWEIHTGRYDRSSKSLSGDDWTVAMKGNAPRESGRRPIIHEPNLQSLTPAAAAVGVKLYNAAGVHEATITAVDRPNDRIRVRYVSSGAIEPKKLSSVAHLWYIRR